MSLSEARGPMFENFIPADHSPLAASAMSLHSLVKIMKLKSIACKVGIAAALLFAGVSAGAADNNPPEQMTYQGFLADANGVGLAPTNPLNYDAVFRIYDSATG